MHTRAHAPVQPQVMIFLGSAHAFDKPVEALHQAAQVMADASRAMELGEYSFELLHDLDVAKTDDGYDTDYLESLIE